MDQRKNRENRKAIKKGIVETIDTHIINTSHLRPIVSHGSTFQDRVESKQLGLDSNNKKTISIIEKIDKKLKIKDEHNSQTTNLNKEGKISVIKTNNT